MFLSVETIKSQVTRDLCCKTKTGDYNVLSLLSWQRSCTTRWASIKGTWKSWQLASWLNLKCEKKLFQMMPKWPGEVFLGCGKRWKTSQVFFFYFSLGLLSRKFNMFITNLQIVLSDLHLHLQPRNHSSKRHSSPLGTTNTFFFFPCSFPEH